MARSKSGYNPKQQHKILGRFQELCRGGMTQKQAAAQIVTEFGITLDFDLLRKRIWGWNFQFLNGIHTQYISGADEERQRCHVAAWEAGMARGMTPAEAAARAGGFHLKSLEYLQGVFAKQDAVGPVNASVTAPGESLAFQEASPAHVVAQDVKILITIKASGGVTVEVSPGNANSSKDSGDQGPRVLQFVQ